MIFEPAGIASQFEDTIVQKAPAFPEYSEHSFLTCSVPSTPDAGSDDNAIPKPAINAAIIPCFTGSSLSHCTKGLMSARPSPAGFLSVTVPIQETRPARKVREAAVSLNCCDRE